MRRIGLLYDYEFGERPGGAARVAQRVMDHVPLESVDLIPCPPGTVDRDCDGYVLFTTKRYGADEYEFILGQSYVRYEHDYWRNVEAGAAWRDRLNENAKLLLFCSELHRSVYRTYHGPLSCRTDVLAPPLNPEPFASIRESVTERTGAIWFADWQWHKGPDIAMRWAGENRVVTDFYSPTLPTNQRSANMFCRLQGFAPEEGWFNQIASHETFIHFPRQPEPWPYSVQEAYLLGCDVVMAGRLGVEDSGVERACEASARSAERFWEVVLNAL